MIEAHEVNRTTVPGPQDSNRERENVFSNSEGGRYRTWRKGKLV